MPPVASRVSGASRAIETHKGKRMGSGPRPRTIVIAIVVLVVVTAAIGLVVVPRVRNALAGADGIHDAGALPGRIQLCGRSWRKDELARTFTAAGIREEFGVDPMVVDPGPCASCPPGPCTDVAQAEPCHVVIWVRVGQDGYMDYSLQGGP